MTTSTPAPETAVKSVLVVEDDPDIALMVERRLASNGLRVRVAASGDEALRLAIEAPPDLIVLDLMLPGMDGYKFARILRQQAGCAGVPIVVASSLTHRDNRKRAMKEARAAAYLTKPFDARDLAATVEALLSDRHRNAPLTREPSR